MQDVEEAMGILQEQMKQVRDVPYERLSELMGASNVQSFDLAGPSGIEYDVEVESVWDDVPNGNIRVNIVVFEKGWTSFIPVTGSFVMAPDGTISEDGSEED